MNDPYETADPSPDHPKSTAVKPVPDEPPPRIGRYQGRKILGKGGFGLVYLANDEQLDRLVAIKVPHRNLLASPEDAQEYLSEARTVAKLDHPNIVPVFDVGGNAEHPCFIVSKFIEGCTLARKIADDRAPVNEIAELVATIAEALHYAHSRGVVHRDIKPSNILLDTAGKPYVADFGLALKDENVGRGPRYAGTPAYMSPEQARGEGHRVDGRSDIFSLGVVFYELLTGRRPFKGESPAEVLDQIATFEPRPPRQWDAGIARELERICFKALAKRASDRYSTARDMADDLRHWIGTLGESHRANEVEPKPVQPDLAAAPSVGKDVFLSYASSDQRPLKIIPRGLRSFDAHDADFFLELLPGPCDRDGLPDSLRFWKTRIETPDAHATFSVGLIYGPSGCGKSSLMKAGLLPRLANSVTAVYVEAAGEETEARLLKALRRQVPDLPANLSLIESLAAVRQGRFIKLGQKVLLVLDQFEQWLHAKQHEENSELVQALRQCDGGRLQCVVMVRDDFGMAATRFMRALDIRLVEGDNFATVDLFDPRHARKVLTAFGRAFAALPEPAKGLTKEQDAFLDQAIAGLAQDGKVISVRLALFAEMVKAKPWTPATLKEMGGTAGVGVTFLEETFSRTANPRHRLHQQAAQAVLKSLLPEAGTDIKGSMRSHAELLEASGYAGRPKDFDDLIRVLDGEIRLITPTDPEGVAGDELQVTGENTTTPPLTTSRASSATRFYQLTHDYLVPSLRDWLTRKQKESRRGRAELLLADRAAVWTARAENRQLPSLMQWFQIKWRTRKKNWTPPQRKMMSKATRYHAVRGLVFAVLLALIGWGSYEGHGRLQARALRDRLLNANTTDVPIIVADMDPYRRWLDPLLHDAQAQAENDNDRRKRLHTSLALLPGDASQVTYLYERLLDAEPDEVQVIRDTLAPHKEPLVDKLWALVQVPAKGQEKQRLRAAAALATYDPDSPHWATVCEAVADDLVKVPAVYLKAWLEACRPVRAQLLDSLAEIFREPGRRDAERSLATDILADYAADQPELLANLLMDGDDKQFATIYPRFKEQNERGQPVLTAEIDRKLVIVQDKIVFETKNEIADDDPKVKPSHGGPLPAKRFEVPLQAWKNYRVTMDSKELDSFLVLQDKTGKELAFDDDGGGGLNAMIVYSPARDATYRVFAASFKGTTGSFHLRIVETSPGDDAKEKLAKRQANAAVALLKMNQPAKVWPLLKRAPPDDPRVRSYLIHRMSPLGADAGAIIQRLEEERDITIRRALLLSLGEYGEQEPSLAARQALLPKLQTIYAADPDPGLHAAAEWLLRRWKQESWLKKVNDDWAGGKVEGSGCWLPGKKAEISSPVGPRWYVTSQGQTMVLIPGPVEFMMGSPPTEVGRAAYETQHKRRIGRTFAIAAKPVTMAQIAALRPGYFGKDEALVRRYAPGDDCPALGLSWHDAAEYCNWLSAAEGIDIDEQCYEIKNGLVTKLKANYLSLKGYRLPSEAEMEYATRAGAVTARFFGETEELLPKYAWYQKNSAEKTWPVGGLQPNDFGLFDVQGNAFTWCQDSYKNYPDNKRIDIVEDLEDSDSIVIANGRVLRGGSFLDLAVNVRSANRYRSVPTYRGDDLGFRPARTLSLVLFTALPPTPEGGRK